MESVASRIQSAGAKAVITSDEGVRGGKRIPLKVCMCECKRSKIGKCYFGELPPVKVPMIRIEKQDCAWCNSSRDA